MNVKMSDPYNTEKLYPVLEESKVPTARPATPTAPSPHEYRINSCRKMLEIIEADAKHYGGTLKKYTRSRNIFSYLAGTTTGASVVLSASGVGTSVTLVGIPVGIALGALGGLCATLGLGFGIASRKMSKKVSKHVDNVARARATIIAIESAISKALRDNVISDEEFRIVTNIDNKYHNRLASMRRSVNSQDFKKIREQVEEEMKAGFEELKQITTTHQR